MSLNLQAAPDHEGWGDLARTFAVASSNDLERPHWTAEDQVVPVGQNYVDLTIMLDWGEVTPAHIGIALLTLGFEPIAFTHESSSIILPPGVAGSLQRTPPSVLPIDPPIAVQAFQLVGLGGIVGPGHLGYVGLNVRLNIEEGFLVNPGDSLEIRMVLAAMQGFPANETQVTITRAQLPTFDIIYQGNSQQGGTVENLPANQTGLTAGVHPLTLTPEATPTHSPVLRNGVLTHVNFVGWTLAPVTTIWEDAVPPPIVTNVEITNADVNVYAAWSWGTCVDCNECPGCNDCFDCDDLEPCDCDSGYCVDCCVNCDFSIFYRGNAQSGGTVSQLPDTQTGLTPGVRPLTPGAAPTHSPVLREGVLTNVVFEGWTLAPTTGIFGEGDTLPTRVTEVTISTANVAVYAVWSWGHCVDCNECPGCNDCFDCNDLEPCECDSGYCVDCCELCDFSIFYRGNAQLGGTVSQLPATQTGLTPGVRPLTPGAAPTHSPVERGGILTHVVFEGWTLAPTTQIFGEGDTLPTRVTNVTISTADVAVYAVWSWGTCVDCNECLGCNDCFDCDDVEPCDCDSGYCVDCCDCCDCDFICIECDECCDVEPCDCGSGKCTDCCEECDFTITYNGNALLGGTVSQVPTARTGLVAGEHTLTTGNPSHSPVLRNGVLTHVVFEGWSLTRSTQIFGEGATLPERVTSVTISTANITVFAVWSWGTCVDCNECLDCGDCFDCGDVEPCDCDSGYCVDCCDCCDCDFICIECDECCDVEPCDCDSGKCTDCCEECVVVTFSILYHGNALQGGTVGSVPENQVNLTPGNHTIRTGMPAHSDLNRAGELTSVRFVGWSTVPQSHIFAGGESANLPAGWLNPRDIPTPTVAITNADVNLHAIWGWSTDGGEIPDVLRFDLTVTNVGMARPNDQTPVSTHNVVPGSTIGPWVPGTPELGFEFLGWVGTDVRLAIGQQFPVQDRITPLTVMPDGQYRVWAVWGNDEGYIGLRNTRPLTVRNTPATVTTTGQSPVTNPTQEVTSTLTWNPGTAAPPEPQASWTFLGWASTREGLVVGQVPPAGMLMTTQAIQAALPTMPNVPVLRYAVWGDDEGRYGIPNPPPVGRGPDINIDVDEDGGVTSNIPNNPYERDNDGIITIPLPPGTDGDINVNLPGGDWNYEIIRDGDGNPIRVVITPPTRPLVVTNLPDQITRPTNQTPISRNDLRVGATIGPWASGTAPERWHFLGWASSNQGLVVGQPVPNEILIPPAQLPTRMTGNGITVFALWGDGQGRFGQPDPPPVGDPTFTLTFVPNGQQNGTVSNMPANRTGLAPGAHGLGNVTPTHTPVNRNGVSTHVVFRGWSAAPANQIFAPGATLPTLLTEVTITDANVRVYAVWGWGLPVTPEDDKRPVPKTGDTSNMILWMTLFGLGLLGFAATSTKLTASRFSKVKPKVIVIEDAYHDEYHIIK